MYNTIRKSRSYIYTAKLAKPQVLQRHKIERLNFSQQVMTWDNQWIQIIFSDEKKNEIWMDKDGWKYYWYDLRKEKEIFSSCPFSGGSVITWWCSAYNSVVLIAFVSE